MSRANRVTGPRLVIGPLAAAVIVLGSCERESEQNVYAPPPPPEVHVSAPIQKEVTKELRYTGQVIPKATVELRARVQGFLEQMNFREGQLVKEDDLLYVIDKRQYEAAVNRAAAQVEATKASLEGAINDAKLAEDLAAQNAGPRIDAIIKAARRDTIAAQLDADKAALASARLDLDFCEIRAPMGGRISKSNVDVGNLVGRDGPTLLATIVQDDPVYVNVDVSEADVLMVRQIISQSGERVEGLQPGEVAPGRWRDVYLTIPGHEQHRFDGHVNYVAPQLDQETGTLRVRGVFENPLNVLVPGIFVSMHFPISTYETLLVPDAALLSDQLGRYALVIDANDTVQQRRVTAGERRGSLREVSSGLQPTDRVIVLGVLKARPGSKVTPKMVEIKDGAAAS
ncbi:MAG: efflux RND transporter periplasmic adaptor subunit [Phycisphaeraceae bacterium]|nr:efflux RND transporter periplasmic adaptor subunit [Phycisphaeraceae bacterium]